MLTSLTVENWKSFEKAKLYIDALTVLIGMNASGKSNILDGLDFLSRIANGMTLTAALQGSSAMPQIRGGIEWAARRPGHSFSIKATYRANETLDYEYGVECVVNHSRCDIHAEFLDRMEYTLDRNGNRVAQTEGRSRLFTVEQTPGLSSTSVFALINLEQSQLRWRLDGSLCALYQLAYMTADIEAVKIIGDIAKTIGNIFMLTPMPAHMRAFSSLADRLQTDAGNIAGVIAALSDQERHEIENTLTIYAQRLPEGDVTRVYTETVGQLRIDAMLYCEENFSENGSTYTIDARNMSDGTLRFLAILTGLLTRPKGSLLAIEEVDNGLHPSRSGLLLNMLRDVGRNRGVDILVTTHNPALLDAASTDIVPFITVVHRDPETGASCLTLLEDVEQLPKLLAQGRVGRISSQD